MKWKVIVYKDGTYKWLKESEPVTPDENWLVTIPAAVDEQPSTDKDKEIEEYSRNLKNAADRCGKLTNDIYQQQKEIEKLKGIIFMMETQNFSS